VARIEQTVSGARRTRTGLLREREEKPLSIELDPDSLLVCGGCYGLRGLGEYGQRCRCQPRRRNEPLERREWSLCSCCGIEPVPDGYRWASLHCKVCQRWVRALNRALGRCAIPVGRHSLMNAVGLSSDEADPVVIERFPAKLTGFFAAVGQVEEWRRTVVRENLAALGFPPGQEVRLSDYLNAGRRRIDKQQAFERLCEHFASRN
jgi:hypothetical protein